MKDLKKKVLLLTKVKKRLQSKNRTIKTTLNEQEKKQKEKKQKKKYWLAY